MCDSQWLTVLFIFDDECGIVISSFNIESYLPVISRNVITVYLHPHTFGVFTSCECYLTLCGPSAHYRSLVTVTAPSSRTI